MLSTNLQCLADQLLAYRKTGMMLEPAAVEAIAAILIVSSADAHELETRGVPLTNVVPLFEGVEGGALLGGELKLSESMERLADSYAAFAQTGRDMPGFEIAILCALLYPKAEAARELERNGAPPLAGVKASSPPEEPLSESIKALADGYAGFTESGKRLSSVTVCLMSVMLYTMASAARKLERDSTPIGGNVVSLTDETVDREAGS